MRDTKNELADARIKSHRWIRGLILWLTFVFSCAALYGADVVLQWDANSETDLAGYRVYYGTSSRSYGSPIDVGNTTTYTVSNLAAGTYYFAVTAYNTSNAESGYSNEVWTTIQGSDTTPPVISGVSAGPITSSAATIAWTTNETADTQVEYGLTTSYGSLTALVSTLVTGHSQVVGGLTPGTIYRFRVRSRDAAGNLALSSGFSFTTAQAGCSYSVSPTSRAFTPVAGSGTSSVTTTAGCSWTAVSNAAWITITSGTSGTGSGTVYYSVAANSGGPRTGTLTIAGQTVTITQQGSSCDINSNGAVNSVDLQVLVNVILGISACPGTCDINRDGKVDVVDLQTLGNVILGVRTCP